MRLRVTISYNFNRSYVLWCFLTIHYTPIVHTVNILYQLATSMTRQRMCSVYFVSTVLSSTGDFTKS